MGCARSDEDLDDLIGDACLGRVPARDHQGKGRAASAVHLRLGIDQTGSWDFAVAGD